MRGLPRTIRLAMIGLFTASAVIAISAAPAHANSSGMATNATIATNADGRLEAFTVGIDSNIWHAWQTSPNGAWTSFVTMPFTNHAFNKQRPSVGRNADGRLEVFAIADDGHVWHSWQTSSGWSDWASLGGGFGFVRTAVASNGDSRLEVFAVAPDHTLRHAYQLTTGGWSGWSSLGGTLDNSMGNGIAVGRNADTRLEVFGLTTGGALQHIYQWNTSTGWSGWLTLGTGFDHANATPSVANNADGRLEVFSTTNGVLSHVWQVSNGWSGVASMGISAWGQGVGRNPDGRLEAFAVYAGLVIHSYQLAPNGGWSSWYYMGTNQPETTVPVSVAQNLDGRLEVWVADLSDSSLSHDYYLGNGNWSGWYVL